MNNIHKYNANDIGNFTDEPVKRKMKDTSSTTFRNEKRQDKKHLYRMDPKGSFVVPWQMYEADPYESQAE